MIDLGIDAYTTRSRAIDTSGITWDDVPRYPVSPETVRTLQYMQDIETHTIIYVRSLLATRAIDDPDVATFLACWFYEETFHGRALVRFLEAAGHEATARRRSQQSLGNRIEEAAIRHVARAWPDFIAVHMTWGAINELTTLTGYQRLAEIADHPVLTELLARIMRDEARHFAFYYGHAERRLASPAARRITRFLVDRFWAPVGSGVQSDADVAFLARHLFGGPEGRAAARKIDGTIRRLPGFANAQLIEAFVDRSERGAVPSPQMIASRSQEPAG